MNAVAKEYADALIEAYNYGYMNNKAKTRSAINAAYNVQLGYAKAEGNVKALNEGRGAVLALIV